jgi:broad specificity phosphatase PhoE
MRLYFVRHGESEANTLHIISNRGQRYGLTQQGVAQAHVLADRLAGLSVAAIFTSPLERAVQTAAILSQHLGRQYQVTGALREYDCGILEERSDEEAWRLHREMADAWLIDNQWERRLEQGESFIDIRERFVPFIDALVQSHPEPEHSIILVGHGGLYRLMLPLVLHNIDSEFIDRHGLDYTTCIVVEQRPGGLCCLQWGQTNLMEVEPVNAVARGAQPGEAL